MRKRIQKLAMGKFEHVEPEFLLSTEKIEIEVLEGQAFSGCFSITSVNHIPLKGLVYSSNPHMECLTPQFEGEEVRIQFEFHSEGFIEGDIQKGDFYIICNRGEYNLSFVTSVTKLYAKSSIGKVKNIYDFTKLVQLDYREAYKLFISAGFQNIIKQDEVETQLLYEGLGKASLNPSNMEEFLIGIQKKQEIHFSIAEMNHAFYNIIESQKESIEIKKDQWGYIELEVYNDGGFLIPSKSKVTSEDFLGSTCSYEYYIDYDKMHAGKNFGRLIFENAYQKESFCITVTNVAVRDYLPSQTVEEQKTIVQLTKLYIDYRLKKVTNGIWATKTIEYLNHLIAMKPENEWYPLWKAQALLVSNQKQQAEWLLNDFKRSVLDKTTSIYAFYLYLCTLAEREPSYVNRLTAKIETIYYEHSEDLILFWILLFIKEEYCNNDTRKIRAIEQRVSDGCHSPYLYMEAYYLYWQNPYLLNKLDTFEIHVLYWAARQGVLTRDLSMQIMNLSSSKRVYDPILYKILCVAYNKQKRPEMVAAICTYLIRGQKFGSTYYEWYEKGVEEDLRITGINEAYLMSMDTQKVQNIPKVVQMYFQYNSTIPYKQKAALFRHIITHKEAEPRVYGNYHRIMEEFALAQIKEGHMDDNLAIVYTEMLDNGMVHKEIVHSLSKILYTYKLTCFSTKAVRAHIIHKQLKQVQSVPVVHGVAYFQLYSKDYVIILEDAYGLRFVQGLPYQLTKLMKSGFYLRKCMEYAPYEAAFLLHYFDGRTKSRTFVKEDKEYLYQLLKNDEIREQYKAKLYPEAIRYYEQMDETDRVEEYLHVIQLNWVDRLGRAYIIEQMIEYHMYDEAYGCMKQYGIGGIATAKLVPLCSYLIEQFEYEEEEFLIELSSFVFLCGKYNDVVLRYLCSYFGGTTKNMARLWMAAQSFEQESYELEERLIVQMLYTTEFVDNVADIYESYYNHGGNELVEAAYLYYFAYHYFVKEVIIPRQVFEELELWIQEGKDLQDVGKLALLHYYSEIEELSGKQYELAEILLAEYIGRGMYFAFYQHFNKQLIYKYQLYDRFFVEYRANPKKRVILHYRIETELEEFKSEDMIDMFEGIFVKQFILFFGESIEYYVTEKDGIMIDTTESNLITNHDICCDNNESRYDLLNAMILNMTLQDEKTLQQLMQQYDWYQKMNEKLFKLL